MSKGLRSTDQIEWTQCDTSGWSDTFGYRYRGLRGMKWKRLPGGRWQAKARQRWVLELLASEKVFDARR